MNSSASGDYAYDMNENFRGYAKGIFNLHYDFGSDDRPVIKKIRIVAKERNFMPIQHRIYYRTAATGSYVGPIIAINASYSTGSQAHSNNSQLVTGEATGNGGKFGITPEGSGSLDALELYWTDNEQPVQQILWEFYGLATGSECKINSFEVFEEGPKLPITNGTGIKQWNSKDPEIKKFYQDADGQAGRQSPHGFPTYFTSSISHAIAEPTVPYSAYWQEGIINMPHIRFTSQSNDSLMTDEYHNYDEFTQIWVVRGTMGKQNLTNTIYSDRDTSNKARLFIEGTGFTKGLYMQIDEEIDGTLLTADKIKVDILGKAHDTSGQNTGEWPWSENDDWYNGHTSIHGSFLQNQARIYTFQLQNSGSTRLDGTPFEGQTTSSIGRMWINGGTPIIDTDQQRGDLDFELTGSYSAPTIGGRDAGRGFTSQPSYWGDYQIHEALIYNRMLTKEELTTIHDYLYEKWRLPYGSASIAGVNQHDINLNYLEDINQTTIN